MRWQYNNKKSIDITQFVRLLHHLIATFHRAVAMCYSFRYEWKSANSMIILGSRLKHCYAFIVAAINKPCGMHFECIVCCLMTVDMDFIYYNIIFVHSFSLLGTRDFSFLSAGMFTVTIMLLSGNWSLSLDPMDFIHVSSKSQTIVPI